MFLKRVDFRFFPLFPDVRLTRPEQGDNSAPLAIKDEFLVKILVTNARGHEFVVVELEA